MRFGECQVVYSVERRAVGVPLCCLRLAQPHIYPVRREMWPRQKHFKPIGSELFHSYSTRIFSIPSAPSYIPICPLKRSKFDQAHFSSVDGPTNPFGFFSPPLDLTRAYIVCTGNGKCLWCVVYLAKHIYEQELSAFIVSAFFCPSSSQMWT